MAQKRNRPGPPMTLGNMRKPDMRGPRAVFFGLLAYGGFLFVYSIIVTLGYNSRAFQAWMGMFQTASDFMSSFIPALQVNKGSKAGLGLAVQHLLFVGWSLLIIFVLCTVLDVFVVSRSAWDRLYKYFSKGTLAKLIVLTGFMLFAFLSVFLGGVVLKPDGQMYRGAVKLVPFAGGFFVTAATFFILILSVHALLKKLLGFSGSV